MIVLALFLVGVIACGDDDPAASSSADAAGSCTSLCTKSGFTSGRADVQPNEINCFCEGGTGVVAAGECTSMCTGLGKKGSTFTSGANQPVNACQCD